MQSQTKKKTKQVHFCSFLRAKFESRIFFDKISEQILYLLTEFHHNLHTVAKFIDFQFNNMANALSVVCFFYELLKFTMLRSLLQDEKILTDS